MENKTEYTDSIDNIFVIGLILIMFVIIIGILVRNEKINKRKQQCKFIVVDSMGIMEYKKINNYYDTAWIGNITENDLRIKVELLEGQLSIKDNQLKECYKLVDSITYEIEKEESGVRSIENTFRNGEDLYVKQLIKKDSIINKQKNIIENLKAR